MDEHKLLHRVQYLAYALFINNQEGKEFLRLMKLLHVKTPTFPQPIKCIEEHGGALSWASFREGQITLINSLELLGKNYLDKVEAENQSKEKIT